MSDKFEHKPGQGSIFKNDYKEKDTQPDYKGKGKDIHGNDVEIALWVKESKNGNKYFSYKIQEPYQKGESNDKPQEQGDDLPF